MSGMVCEPTVLRPSGGRMPHGFGMCGRNWPAGTHAVRAARGVGRVAGEDFHRAAPSFEHLFAGGKLWPAPALALPARQHSTPFPDMKSGPNLAEAPSAETPSIGGSQRKQDWPLPGGAFALPG